ncbi:4-diphosphocytidyl-2-C-methyl-D-erythritol kinase [Clostridia bacterium]|nr:4-diphosphocytidyl-2-C-methyl-D-erythritol kinase [Clostridia bacterium]
MNSFTCNATNKNKTQTVKAYAKINFTLDITGKLPNGYHTVNMVMQSVNLQDTLTLNITDTGITIKSNWDFIPTDSSNTVYKAAAEFFAYTNITGGVNVKVEKNIPAQAGLAGGSADAAAVLIGLNSLYKANLPLNELALLGAKVGADVPFCLYGGTKLATGTGTDLHTVNGNFNSYTVLLCKPNIGVSTKEAYDLSDARPYTKVVHSTIFLKYFAQNNLAGMGNSLYNDFDELLTLELVEHIKSIIKQSGGYASMSGSGPTAFGLFANPTDAKNCAQILKKIYKDTFITQPVNYGCKIIL